MVALVNVVKLPEAQICLTIYASYWECSKKKTLLVLRFSNNLKRVDILSVWISREPFSSLGLTWKTLNRLAVLMDLGVGHLPKLV